MNIFDNKPIFQPTFTLDIETQTGINSDTWTPCAVPGSENWLFSVAYDDKILVNHVGVPESGAVKCVLDDDQTNRNHKLTIVLRGLDRSKDQGLKLLLKINDVDVSDIMKHYLCYKHDDQTKPIKYQGQDIMLYNGDQQLPIQTPIYRWMYDRRNLLIGKYWNLKNSE